MGQKVCVGMQINDAGTERYFNGIVSNFEMNGGDEEFNNYRATLVPSLWVLTLNKNTRVFQNMTVIDVIKDVLSVYSISPYSGDFSDLRAVGVLHAVPGDGFPFHLAADGAARHSLLLQAHEERSHSYPAGRLKQAE